MGRPYPAMNLIHRSRSAILAAKAWVNRHFGAPVWSACNCRLHSLRRRARAPGGHRRSLLMPSGQVCCHAILREWTYPLPDTRARADLSQGVPAPNTADQFLLTE